MQIKDFYKTLFIFGCLLFFVKTAHAAQIYILPQTGKIDAGDTILGELRVNTEGENINAFDIKVFYPPEILEIAEVIEGGSLINLWARQPSFSNSEGVLTVQGGRIGGLNGDGLLLKVLFKGKSAGDAAVAFAPSSKALLHDGKGTPAACVFLGAAYGVGKEAEKLIHIQSESHPRQDAWYRAGQVKIEWTPKENAFYSYVFSRDIMENPDDSADEPVGEVARSGLDDGIYYFSIKESLDNQNWSEIIRYRFLEDKIPPERFKILSGQDESVYNGKKFITFAANDKTSGMDYYEVKETKAWYFGFGGEWKKAESPYLPAEQSWSNIIKVKAIDKAGNERVEIFYPAGVKWLAGLLLLMLLFGAGLFLKFKNLLSKFLGIVFAFLILDSLFLIPTAEAQKGASLYLSPSTGSFFVGSTFSVSVFANTGGSDINAVDVGLEFPVDKLQIASPTSGESFISVWVSQPEFSNIKGTLNLQGGLPSPGINTSNGLVTTVTFRVKMPGEAVLKFANSSRILKNDGKGTNVLTSLVGGRYNFLVPPPEGPGVESLSHPDQNLWYSNSNPVFLWRKEAEVNAFSYEFDRNQRTAPDNESEGVQTVQEYSGIEDGIWYFHIKARKTSWGGITHFPIFIDTTPPAVFKPELQFGKITEVQRDSVSFITTDNASGIDHYELKIESLGDGGEDGAVPIFFEVSSPYRLPQLGKGQYKVTVRAYDWAGNWMDQSVELEVIKASLLEHIIFDYLLSRWFLLILALFACLFGAWLIRFTRSKKCPPQCAPEKVDKVFDILEDDLLDKLRELEQAKTKRELTQKEKELHEKIKEDLKISEDYLKGKM